MNVQSNESLLKIRGLRTYFFTPGGISRAVDDVDIDLDEEEVLGLVGESGCGKSVTCLSILRLIPEPSGKIVGGEVLFRGRDLVRMDTASLRRIRGSEISMIFQEPMTSFNPVLTCGNQIAEVICSHKDISKKNAEEQACEMLHSVGIPDPEKRMAEYPHQLSGGMLQRVMIAMALVCHPAVLIADEPTTALDVTVQAQILDLLRHLQKLFHMAVLLITHDLGVIAEISDRVAVMYAGKIQETAPVRLIFHEPLHPYTQGLLASLPSLSKGICRLNAIPGFVPNPTEFPNGCRFHPRCPFADNVCKSDEPALETKKTGHKVRCWKV